MDIDVTGNRKLILCIIGILAVTILAVVGKIDGNLSITAIEWLSGFFVGGNAIEHIAQNIGDK